MKQIAILFFLLSTVEVKEPPKEIAKQAAEPEEPEGLAIQILQLAAKGEIPKLRAKAGDSALIGPMCSDTVFLVSTKEEAFREVVKFFKEAAYKALMSLYRGELKLEQSVSSYVPPGELLQNGDVIVREGCEWGVLFRKEKDKWQFKGLFVRPPEKPNKKNENRRNAPKENSEGPFLYVGLSRLSPPHEELAPT